MTEPPQPEPDDDGLVPCPRCHGEGDVHTVVRVYGQRRRIHRDCPQCEGHRRIPRTQPDKRSDNQ